MRIGEFSERFGVSRDTVRYYIETGLLLPDTGGPQFSFGERECRDMEIILRMKGQRFSIREIRHFLDILRVSTMVEPESIKEVEEILEEKRSELGREIQSLKRIRTEIKSDIRMLSNEQGSLRDSGVPLTALDLLVCPNCKKQLKLKNAFLDNRYVYNASLYCDCGYEIKVEDGIVCTGNLYSGDHDCPDLGRTLYRHLTKDFALILQKCSDATLETLTKIGLKGKVVLEGHANGYFFLYNNIRNLETDCIYILTDKYPEILKMYKSHIDRLGLDLDILYIADALMDWPLKEKCADVLINFTGGNEHSLYFKNPYIEDVKPFLKDSASVTGVLLGYRRDSKSLNNLADNYPEGDISDWRTGERKEMYRKAGFLYTGHTAAVIKDAAKQYSRSCHEDGEELILEEFTAEPLKK